MGYHIPKVPESIYLEEMTFPYLLQHYHYSEIYEPDRQGYKFSARSLPKAACFFLEFALLTKTQ
jgi:hypothetical protein